MKIVIMYFCIVQLDEFCTFFINKIKLSRCNKTQTSTFWICFYGLQTSQISAAEWVISIKYPKIANKKEIWEKKIKCWILLETCKFISTQDRTKNFLRNWHMWQPLHQGNFRIDKFVIYLLIIVIILFNLVNKNLVLKN